MVMERYQLHEKPAFELLVRVLGSDLLQRRA